MRRAIQGAVAMALWACSWGSATLGCAASGEEPSDVPPPIARLTIWNQSAFELLELYVTQDVQYAGATNLLDVPLPDDARININFDNDSYVTVVRRRVQAGERIAFTTTQPIHVPEHYYLLSVFQESFRLEQPDGEGPFDDGHSGGDPGAGD